MRISCLACASLVLMTASCGGGGATKADAPAGGACKLDLAAAPDGTPILKGECPRDAASVAAAITRAPAVAKTAREIALGRVALAPGGAFDRCAVMARLAADPRWTPSVDSAAAAPPLHDALKTGGLAPPVSSALAGAGRKLRGVSLEMVLLSDGPAADCAKSPARAPSEAQVWLLLE
jgi:hypothetical protein